MLSEERRCPECWHKEISHIEELGVCVVWVTDNGQTCGCEYRFAGCLRARIDYRGIVADLDDTQRRADKEIYAHPVHLNRNEQLCSKCQKPVDPKTRWKCAGIWHPECYPRENLPPA